MIFAALLLLEYGGAIGSILWSQTAGSAGQKNATKPPATGKTGSSHADGIHPAAAHSSPQGTNLQELRILPSSVTLNGSLASQRLVIEGRFADGHEEDVTSQAKLSAAEPQVAAIDDQAYVHGKGDGQTTLRASLRGRSASAEVMVRNSGAAVEWSFRNQVIPVMTKVGCNSGACHGAAAGKNGFKLTLRGYDPETDYYTLTRQALGRRTVPLEPAKSLILLKPTYTIQHGGGRRFPVGSPEYQVISGWIAAGMPPPRDSDPRVVAVEVLPRHVTTRQGAEQQLLVRARYSDGHAEDVTRWAKYSTGDEGVANVDDFGHVKMRGYGEAPINVWYQSQVAFATLTVPFPSVLDAKIFRAAARHNYIDELVLNKLEALHIPPSRPTTDAEFLRRAYLDAAGILPTSAETEKFLADRSPDKRQRLIDELLSRPEFIDYWTYKWSDLLLVSSEKLAPNDMWSYYNWIRESVATNKPWDRFAYEIVTASGNTRENGATNYYAIQRDPIDISENVTKAFVGMSITCARCHNHPLEKWTQNDYYAMANLFSRVRLKTGQRSRGRRELEDVTVFTSPVGEIMHPRLGRPMPPRPLDAQPLPLDSPEDRRVYFARWLTSPENPYFARALVNRVWRNFMGRGLVEPVDDMRATNPPTNHELLEALVKDFAGHGFDVKNLIRTIMKSATYQTSSEPRRLNAQDEKYYSHYFIRRLPAEVLLDAISKVTQVPEIFEGYPVGLRSLQLPDTRVEDYFLTVFGRPPRQQTSESERQSQPNITQALHIINGQTLNNKLRAPGSTVDMMLKLGISDERVVEYLFLSAFSRYPTDVERNKFVDDLRGAGAKNGTPQDSAKSKRPALEDLMWAMLTSDEFMFNH
jgi:hypothetical protein